MTLDNKMNQYDSIKNTVKEAFEIPIKYNTPSQYQIYIFFLIKSGMILFNDTMVDVNVLHRMCEEEVIKADCIAFHQTEKAIRYKFLGYNYTEKYKRNASPKLRAEVYKKDGYRCTNCYSDRRLTVDHIIPWSLGGYTEYGNLQTLCKSCNSSKSNR